MRKPIAKTAKDVCCSSHARWLASGMILVLAACGDSTIASNAANTVKPGATSAMGRGETEHKLPAKRTEGRGRSASTKPENRKVASANSVSTIRVKKADGAVVVEIRREVEGPAIQYKNAIGELVTIRAHQSGSKRAYVQNGKGVLFLVKVKKNGFKLLSERGTLLWKAKIRPDKIKVSDNEENLHALVIKVRNDDSAKVFDDQLELGKVRYYPDKGRLKVKNAIGTEEYWAKADKFSAAYGVLLMDRMDESARYVILAEILRLGR